MAYVFKTAEKLVGVFVVLGGLVLVVGVILIGRGGDWFAKKHHYYSWFNEGSGINAGMPVTFHGVGIGKVTKVRLNEQNKMDLNISILDEYHDRIRTDSVLVMRKGLIPGLTKTAFEISLGTNETLLAGGSLILSSDMSNGRRLLEQRRLLARDTMLDEIAASISRLVVTINDRMGPNGEITAVLRELGPTLAALRENQLLADRTFLKKELEKTLGNLNSLLVRADRETLPELNRTIKELRALLETLKANPIIGGPGGGEKENGARRRPR
jgi:phospholipid/cholesterol/gamma-HCH transport system substrate-binding protein